MKFIPLLDRPVVAVWKMCRVKPGQRLLGLRGKTENNTMYLFDSDNRRVGWVSADVLNAVKFEVSDSECYIARVTATDDDGDYPRLAVHLGELVDSKPFLDTYALALRWRGSNTFPARADILGQSPVMHTYLIETDHYDGMATVRSETQPTPGKAIKKAAITKEEPIMKNAVTSRLSAVAEANMGAVKNAAYIEAGTIVNRQLTKLAMAKAPMMLRGYLDNSIGKLVVANIFAVAMRELRPGNVQLQTLADAAILSAYQDVIRTIDLDGMIDELLSSETIKRVLAKDGEQA